MGLRLRDFPLGMTLVLLWGIVPYGVAATAGGSSCPQRSHRRATGAELLREHPGRGLRDHLTLKPIEPVIGKGLARVAPAPALLE